jgi:hypothetical protein
MPDGDPPRLEGVRLRWHFGYWDGPINGVATYDGRDYWFDAEPFDWEDEPPHSRRYFLYELTDEELAEERYWHERFRDLVGTHTEYDEEWQRLSGEVRPPSGAFDREYAQRKQPDYMSRPSTGWFAIPGYVSSWRD